MWQRNNSSPLLNVPQALVDIATALKDQSWLPSMAEAAKELAGANRLTEEEAAALKAAQEYVAGAGKLQDAMVADLADLTIAQTKLAGEKALVSKREQQCDERTAQISKDEAKLSAGLQQLATGQKEVADGKKQLAHDVEEYIKDKKQLELDQQDVYDREQALTNAASAVKRKAV